MKIAVIFLSMMLGVTGSTPYLNAPEGKYTIKSTTASPKLPSGMAQVKFEFKFSAACKTGTVKLAVDGAAAPKTASIKNPRMNMMVKKGKHVFQLMSSTCDTVTTQTLDLGEKTSTTIEVEY